MGKIRLISAILGGEGGRGGRWGLMVLGKGRVSPVCRINSAMHTVGKVHRFSVKYISDLDIMLVYDTQ